MGGTTLKNLQMFERLCGKDCLHNVTLVTTMWDDVEEHIGTEREKQLREDYFAAMIAKQADLVRADNTPSSTQGIISTIIKNLKTLHPLELQKELVAYQMDLPNTRAGKKMYEKLEGVLQAHHAALQQHVYASLLSFSFHHLVSQQLDCCSVVY
ncbi:hypothetical protein CVT24_007786 [Panaeolus cyanescens]|uniref:Uncharacterized protein n=1 Tax=Panaeolus cyanescens TaxID=181874 RepID=A0A409YKT4_9AGAR|nr:hypothetical protein CVT24_007786 [Panaeolus cyanescens]